MPKSQRVSESAVRTPSRLGALALAGLIAVALALPATALARGHYGTATILDGATGTERIVDGEPEVCGVAFVFDFAVDGPVDVVGWEVRVWAEERFDGEKVHSGEAGPTDADGVIRVPESGFLGLANGRYTVIWDDEADPDRSAGHRSFRVNCAGDVDQEIATPTPVVTPTPTGGVAPEITLPPTDSAGGTGSAVGTGLPLVLAVLAIVSLALAGSVKVLRPKPRHIRR